jgi:hypothetical protein
MSRRWILVALVALAGLAPSLAEAGRGRRGPHYSMTPYGPIPGGVSLPAYEQMVEQRQMMMQQQMLYRQQQAMAQQSLKSQQQARKAGKAGREAPPTLQPQPNRGNAARPIRKQARTKGDTTKAVPPSDATTKTKTTESETEATTRP